MESESEDVKNELEYEDTFSKDDDHETKFVDSCNAKSDLSRFQILIQYTLLDTGMTHTTMIIHVHL